MSKQLTTAAALFEKPLTRRFKTVTVALGTFRLRNLNALEETRLAMEQYDAKGNIIAEVRDNSGARRVVACCVDEDGNPAFTEADIPKLMQLDGAKLGELVAECVEHCEEVDGAALEKN